MPKVYAIFSIIFISFFLSFIVLTASSAKVLVAQTEPGIVGELCQRLGIPQETIDNELASGRTPVQIAEEYGMPERTFYAKISKKYHPKKVVVPIKKSSVKIKK